MFVTDVMYGWKDRRCKMSELIGQKEGIVKWISNSEKNNSFNLIEDEKVWYQVEGGLIEEYLNKNDKVEFKFTLEGPNRVVQAEDLQVTGKEKPAEKENWQDDMVDFETLLASAHEKFNGDGKRMRITTSIVAYDMEKKWAIFQAIVSVFTLDGELMESYQAHGDATQENCNSTMIKPHFLRMAETRAVARALRFATNNAKVAKEETQ